MRKALIVTVALLSLSSLVLAQIPFERAVSTVVYGPAPGEQVMPAVASNGKDFMLVWPDFGRSALYAARVGADGSLFDDTGLRIAPAKPADGYRPSIFWTGTAYVVFWIEQFPYSLHSARLDAEGGILEPPHLVLDNAFVGSIDTNGARFVASYEDKVAVLDINGHLLEKDIKLPIVQPNVANATITSNGTRFLATWAGGAGANGVEIDGVALDAFGHPAASGQLFVAHAGGWPAVASNGSDYVLVYRELLTAAFFTQHVSADGQLLGTPLALPAPQGVATDIVLRWNGSQYLLSWVLFIESSGKQDIAAVRIDANGLSLDAAPKVLATASESSQMASLAAWHDTASNGANILVTWTDAGVPSMFKHNINAAVVSAASMARTQPLVVSRSAAPQTSPHIAFSGRNYLVVWEEMGVVYGARVTMDGRTLDPRGFRLTGSSAVQSMPNVIFDGGSYVVGWETRAGDVATLTLNRVNPDTGALQNGDGVAIATSCGEFPYDLATDGTLTMVAFSDCHVSRIAVERFNRALLPLDVPLTITPSSMLASFPSVAWSGSQWVVAFQEMIVLPSQILIPGFFEYRGNVRAVRITPSMTRLDTEPVAIAVSSDDRNDQGGPHVASSGNDYLIGWTRAMPNAAEVRARHFHANGTMSGSAGDFGVFIAAGASSSTIWTGTRYAIGFSSRDGDALGATLGAGAEASPSGFFKIAGTPDVDALPMLVSVNNRVTAAYVRVATEPLYGGVARIFVRDARPLHGRVAGH